MEKNPAVCRKFDRSQKVMNLLKMKIDTIMFWNSYTVILKRKHLFNV